jgi:hypothetical protein
MTRRRDKCPEQVFTSELSFADMPSYKPTTFIRIGDHMAKKLKRVAWTAENVRTLKSMAKKKTSAGKIAKRLKRTEGATRQKAFSIGLSLDSRD